MPFVVKRAYLIPISMQTDGPVDGKENTVYLPTSQTRTFPRFPNNYRQRNEVLSK